MPRTANDSVYQVTSPFVVYTGRVPEVYGMDRLVAGDDPILKSHGAYFQSVVKRIERQTQAAPTARHTPAPPVMPEKEQTDG